MLSDIIFDSSILSKGTLHKFENFKYLTGVKHMDVP